jgi:3-hydroxyacyl-[acyl-carrier-protein] dehydratase
LRFHLVDIVDAWAGGGSIRARKLTSSSEDYWITVSGSPVMPAWLVLEAICQAGSYLLLLSTEGRKRAALLGIERVEFVSDVRPGDVIELTGEVSSFDEEAALFSGTAAVEGRLVARATDILCTLLDADRLEDPAATAVRLGALTRQIEIAGGA